MESETNVEIKKGTKNKEGLKYDGGKLRWSLIPFLALEDIVKVLTIGEKKYIKDNWKYVDNATERYTDALFRHLSAWMRGEQFDKETGLSHLAHAGTNILFLIWFGKMKRKRSKNG